MLGFGTILVQTFVGDMMIDNVMHPQKVQQHLVKIIKELGFTNFMEQAMGAAQPADEDE